MADLVVGTAVVRFEPTPDWSWHAWDGRLRVRPPGRGFDIDGLCVALAQDITALAADLKGRLYVTPEFNAKPGVVGSALVEVDQESLSRASRLTGQRIVINETTGEFFVTIEQPAQAAGVPPPTDTVLRKQGRLCIEDPAQGCVRTP